MTEVSQVCIAINSDYVVSISKCAPVAMSFKPYSVEEGGKWWRCHGRLRCRPGRCAGVRCVAMSLLLLMSAVFEDEEEKGEKDCEGSTL